MKLEKVKGTKNYTPEEKITRQFIVNTIIKVAERYGFNPLETSLLENLGSLSAKYAGGDEILKEIYKLKDQGKRDLGLRYDLTVPLCLFVGMNPTMKLPFKRYEVGKVFRDGPIKLGRLREFWQFDVDIIGSKGMLAETEVLSFTKDAFKELGLNVVIKVNNRKLLNSLINAAGILKNKDSAILSIDKLEKFGSEIVEKELLEKGFEKNSVKKLLELISIKGTNKEILTSLKQKIKNCEGIVEVEELLSYMGENIKLDTSLARGLVYYTGPIFEVYNKQGKVRSSLAGGGRYDKMISSFLGSKREYPATGISFGIEPILESMREKGIDFKKSVSKVWVIPIGTVKESLSIVQELRNNRINADIDTMSRGPSKNLDYANTFKIPYVIFVGEDEVKENKVKLKDMGSGKEELLSVKEVIKKLQ